MKRICLIFSLITLPLFADLDQAWRTLMAENDFDQARQLFERHFSEDSDLAKIGWFLTFTGNGPTPEQYQAAIKIVEEAPYSDAAEFVLHWMYERHEAYADWIEDLGRIYTDAEKANPEMRILLSNYFRILSRYNEDEDLHERAVTLSRLVTDWAFSQKFGAYPIPAFERQWPAEKPEYWTDPIARKNRSGLVVPPSELPGAGVLYAFSEFENPVKQAVDFRLFSGQNVAVYVNGKRLILRKGLESLDAEIMRYTLDLPAGRHEIMVKTTQTRGFNGQFSLQVTAEKQPVFKEPTRPTIAIGGGVHKGRQRQVGLAASIDKSGFAGAGFIQAMLAERARDYQTALELLEAQWEKFPGSQLLGARIVDVYASGNISYLPLEYQQAQAFGLLRNLNAQPNATLENKHMLGLVLVRAKDTRNALELFRQVLEANPGYTEVIEDMYGLSRRENLSDISNRAIEMLEALGPDHRWARERLYKIAVGEGNLEQTRRLLVDLKRLLPGAYTTRLYELDNDYEGAIAYLKEHWELFKDLDYHPFVIADAYRKLGDREQQREWLETTLSVNPGNRDALLQLVNLDCFEGRKAEAMERIREYLLIEPADAEFRQMYSHLEGRTAFESLRVNTADIIEAAKNKPVSQGADSELLLDQLMVRLFPDGSQMRYTHLITRVLTKDGVDRESELRLPGGLEILELRTIKQDGSVFYPENIDHKDTISLAGLSIGDFIDEEHIEYLPPADYDADGLDGSMSFIFQGFDRIYHHSELVLIYPEDLEPKPTLLSRNMPAPPEEYTKDGLRYVRWLTKDMPPLRGEPYMPPAGHFQPAATFHYNTEWEEIRDYYRHVIRTRLDRSHRLEGQIDEWRALDLSKRKLAEHVYTTVVDKIESERRFYKDVNQVWESGQGNATLLLASIYDALDIPCDIVLTRFAAARAVTFKSPLPEVFGHALLRLKLDGKIIFIDANQKGVSFGYVPFFYRGSDGLVLNGEELFIDIPMYDDSSEVIESTYQMQLKGDGSVEVEGSETFNGSLASQLEQSYESLNYPEIKQRVEAGVNGNFPGAVVTDVEVIKDLPRGQFELRNKFRQSKLGTVSGDRIEVPFCLPKNSIKSSYASQPERRLPIQILNPHINQGVVDLKLPENFVWDVKPVKRVNESAFGSYRLEVTVVDARHLRIERHYHLPAQLIHPESYQEFLEFSTAILENENLTFTAKRDGKAHED